MHAIETTASFDAKGEIKIDKSLIIKNQKVKLLILLPDMLNEVNPDFKS